MINVLHLIWIIPLSMVAGIGVFCCISAAIVSSLSDDEEEEIERYIKERKNDN